MVEQDEALRQQVADFALGVLRFVRGLRRDVASDSIIRHIARGAGSVSGNYRAACSARSLPESISKLGIALAEADEIAHWFWMAGQLRLGNSQKLAALDAEAKQLRAILAESISTARRNLQRELETRRIER